MIELERKIIPLIDRYCYINNGFTVSEYNLMGQVTRVNTDKAEVQYSYNVSGLRKSKTVNSETTNFIWNGQNMIAEANGDDVIQNIYTYDMTGVILRNGSDWYLKNARGDVVGMVDSGNNLIQEYRYDAFGNQIGRDENDTNPFRYSGEYWDGETENIYLRARMYDPGAGRFTSEDPAKDGLNWYSYCAGNPVMFSDPSGYINLPTSGDYGDGNYSGNTLIGLALDTLVYFVSDYYGMTESKNYAHWHAQNLRSSSEVVNDSWSRDTVFHAKWLAEEYGNIGSKEYNFGALMGIFREIDTNMHLADGNGLGAFYGSELQSKFITFLTGIEVPSEGYKEPVLFSDEMIENFENLSDAINNASVQVFYKGGKVSIITEQNLDTGKWGIRVRGIDTNGQVIYDELTFTNLYPF